MSTAASKIRVDVQDRQRAERIDIEHLVELLERSLADQHGDAAAEVGLSFVGVDEMTGLNMQHMGGSGPTDVLAFPIDGVSGHAVPQDQPAMLGDIVVCPQVAAKAPQPLPDELALLVVHGALHLLGHDHAEPQEAAVMKALEDELLERFHA